jgi:hypothetical protein
LVYYFFSRIFFEKYGSRNGLGAKLLAFRPYTPFHLPSALSLLYRLSLVFGGIGVLHGTSSHTHTHTHTHIHTHTHAHTLISFGTRFESHCLSAGLTPQLSFGTRHSRYIVLDRITFRWCKSCHRRRCLQDASFLNLC